MAQVAADVADKRALVRQEPLSPIHGGTHCKSREHHGARVHQRVSRHDRYRQAKLVLAETGASHVSLHNYFGVHKVNVANIAKLLASIQKHTKPVNPSDLGIIGKDHLYCMMELAGVTLRHSHTTAKSARPTACRV